MINSASIRLITIFSKMLDRILDIIFHEKSRPEEGHSSDLLFGVRINFELGRSYLLIISQVFGIPLRPIKKDLAALTARPLNHIRYLVET